MADYGMQQMGKAGGSGIKQHKNMATGKAIPDEGNFGVAKVNSGAASMASGGPDFGVGSFAENFAGKTHPDASMKTGKVSSDRAVSDPIKRGKGMMPATAHSDHGPHHW